jgi:hypothetical protein
MATQDESGIRLKRLWPLLVVRWAVFAAIITAISLVAGTGTATSILLGLLGGGALNAAWCWVA